MPAPLMAAISSNRLGVETQTLSNSSASAHTVSFELQAGGTWAAKSDVNGVFASGNWILQTQRADRCAVTATYVSDDPGLGVSPRYTGTFGSSLALTSLRTWTVEVGSDPDGPSNVVFDLDFTIDGNPLGDTVRITLQAE